MQKRYSLQTCQSILSRCSALILTVLRLLLGLTHLGTLRRVNVMKLADKRILREAIGMRMDNPRLNISNLAKRLRVSNDFLKSLYLEEIHNLQHRDNTYSYQKIVEIIFISKKTVCLMVNGRTRKRISIYSKPPIEPFNETLHSRYMNTIFAFGGFGIYKGLTE